MPRFYGYFAAAVPAQQGQDCLGAAGGLPDALKLGNGDVEVGQEALLDDEVDVVDEIKRRSALDVALSGEVGAGLRFDGIELDLQQRLLESRGLGRRRRESLGGRCYWWNVRWSSLLCRCQQLNHGLLGVGGRWSRFRLAVPLCGCEMMGSFIRATGPMWRL